MRDDYGREIDYLRLSITDRCNLRCQYCMPEGCNWLPMERILTYEEMEQICTIGAGLGIRKVKLTGGEPLVRSDCADLVKRLCAIDGIEQVTLTTNGVLLAEYAEALRENGLTAVNISLDTLDREKYTQITGRDELPSVLKGIRAAKEAGLTVKLNAVLQRGVNQGEWAELLNFALSEGVILRFIEMMPIGHGAEFQTVSNHWLQEQVAQRYGSLQPDGISHGNGPAVYYKLQNGGSVGLISAIHGRFCAQCNRVRLTATGFLKACLCYEDGADLREALRKGDLLTVEQRMKSVMRKKPEQHCFERYQDITERHEMSKIGG